MSALRAALFEWDRERIVSVVIAGVAVSLGHRVTDGFLTELGATVLFAIVLTTPWMLVDRLTDRSSDP